MKKKSTVWVVEQGCYSDYRVVGAFTSKANAELVAGAINSGEYVSDRASVDEWELDPAVDSLRKGYRQYAVLMLRDGSVEGDVRTFDVSSYQIGGDVRIWERSKAPAYAGKGVPDVLQATVWAKNETHAIKITNEHRVRMIASGKWVGEA